MRPHTESNWTRNTGLHSAFSGLRHEIRRFLLGERNAHRGRAFPCGRRRENLRCRELGVARQSDASELAEADCAEGQERRPSLAQDAAALAHEALNNLSVDLPRPIKWQLGDEVDPARMRLGEAELLELVFADLRPLRLDDHRHRHDRDLGDTCILQQRVLDLAEKSRLSIKAALLKEQTPLAPNPTGRRASESATWFRPTERLTPTGRRRIGGASR
jgi:hypothetical protein